ncbi:MULTISPECIES: hypothetical protein [unclassified Dyella]|uniref:hypothetical protein n=1 Tax=unclassified Dyella TaxID=2634549 RepID=UPI000CC27E3A|nr:MULTISPECIES: hypothetical protein [unclassified Dyella]MDR3447193.1 hypothetical protein [Dyella sp.]PMQ06625.1 hypothetical protein DyAD56_03955 [Dyella sp. AD56]
MQRLSSQVMTAFYNKVFPACWYGFLLLSGLLVANHAISTRQPAVLLALAFPAFMVLISIVLAKYEVFVSHMDDVWLDGDQLRVWTKGGQLLVPIANVVKAELSTGAKSPPTVALQLRRESARLGQCIHFVPRGEGGYFSPFEADPVVAELLQRIAAASAQRSA